MSDKNKKPTQKTPKQGYEIPIPTRKDFEDVLDAVAKPAKTLRPRSPKKKRLE